MGHKVAEPCRNCGAELAPGAAFCTLCGTAITNRGATQAPATVPLVGQPLAGQPDATQPAPGAVPGIISVGLSASGPLVAPQQVGGDARLAAATALVPGGAGRRLAAKVIDGVVPTVLMMVALLVYFLLIVLASATKPEQDAPVKVLLALCAAALLSISYGVWLWIWEARSGKSPGNVMLGLRTTNLSGGPAGLLAIFLRNMIIGLGSIVPVFGYIIVNISNTWDPNGKAQGWHDKVADTYVFNVKTGRNPLETGGIEGRAAYVPAPVPTLAPVSSPVPPRPVQGAPAPSAPAPFTGLITSVPGSANSSFAPSHQAAAAPAPNPGAASDNVVTDPFPGMQVTKPLTPEQGGVRAETQLYSDVEVDGDADAEAGETRIRPVAESVRLRLSFDDGSVHDIGQVALIGRNPAGYDGEMISRLIPVRDTSMSVSKTHLHVRPSHEGLWVTDRNSTNGSAITGTDGSRVKLSAGIPAVAEIGATVHFGERSFTVGRP